MVSSSKQSRLSDKRKTEDMAYLILADRDGEFDRRELRGPTIVGRALDCSICVRDILLSRRHCQFERFQDRWVVSDLGSKNGTRVGTETITRHILNDGDVVRLGKIQIAFHAGKFVPPPKDQPQRRRDVRPSDPTEALSGTVLGFQLFDMEEDSRISGFPIPKPKPPEPKSLRQEAVHSMVSQIASSSWDIAVAEQEVKPKPVTREIPREVVERQQDIQKKARLSKPPAPPMSDPAIIAEPSRSPVLAELPPPILEAIEDETPARAVVIRSKDPNRRATIPGWLAGVYIFLTVAIGSAAFAAIIMRSILQ